MEESEVGVKHVQVRFSSEEYATLADAAGDVPLQRFVRGLVLSGIGKADDPLRGVSRPVLDAILTLAELDRNKREPDLVEVVRRTIAAIQKRARERNT